MHTAGTLRWHTVVPVAVRPGLWSCSDDLTACAGPRSFLSSTGDGRDTTGSEQVLWGVSGHLVDAS